MSIEQPEQGTSKKVDEGWKAQAQKEKKGPSGAFPCEATTRGIPGSFPFPAGS